MICVLIITLIILPIIRKILVVFILIVQSCRFFPVIRAVLGKIGPVVYITTLRYHFEVEFPGRTCVNTGMSAVLSA